MRHETRQIIPRRGTKVGLVVDPSDIRQEGTAVFMVEQNAYIALRVATGAYVTESGRITLEGPAPDVLDDEHVRGAYLGG